MRVGRYILGLKKHSKYYLSDCLKIINKQNDVNVLF